MPNFEITYQTVINEKSKTFTESVSAVLMEINDGILTLYDSQNFIIRAYSSWLKVEKE